MSNPAALLYFLTFGQFQFTELRFCLKLQLTSNIHLDCLQFTKIIKDFFPYTKTICEYEYMFLNINDTRRINNVMKHFTYVHIQYRTINGTF